MHQSLNVQHSSTCPQLDGQFDHSLILHHSPLSKNCTFASLTHFAPLAHPFSTSHLVCPSHSPVTCYALVTECAALIHMSPTRWAIRPFTHFAPLTFVKELNFCTTDSLCTSHAPFLHQPLSLPYSLTLHQPLSMHMICETGGHCKVGKRHIIWMRGGHCKVGT